MDLATKLTSLSKKEAERKAAEAIWSLAEFVKQAWPILHPSDPLVWNWHMTLIADLLQRQIDGDPAFQDCVIAIPPGTCKSLLVSVFAPAWEWLKYPSRSKLIFANSEDLLRRDSKRVRDLIESEWYRGLVTAIGATQGKPVWTLSADNNAILNFSNTEHGGRNSLTIDGRVLGQRAHDWVVDDPLDRDMLEKATPDGRAQMLQEVNEKIERTLPTRVNDYRTARRTIIMQRLDEDDPVGRALKKGWPHVVIQMEYDPDFEYNHPDDPRTQPGELMFPAKFPADKLKTLKADMGDDYEAQFQQSPVGREGALFKRDWLAFDHKNEPINRFEGDPRRVQMEQWLMSVDCSFKKANTSDYCVIGIWGRKGSKVYLLDVIRERLDFPGLKTRLKETMALWPFLGPRIVEEAANGYALVQDLGPVVPGIIGWPVAGMGSKYARAQRIVHRFAARDVLFPANEYAPWLPEYHRELAKFDGRPGRRDDQVDMTSQALAYWQNQAPTQSADLAYAGLADAMDKGGSREMMQIMERLGIYG